MAALHFSTGELTADFLEKSWWLIQGAEAGAHQLTLSTAETSLKPDKTGVTSDITVIKQTRNLVTTLTDFAEAFTAAHVVPSQIFKISWLVSVNIPRKVYLLKIFYVLKKEQRVPKLFPENPENVLGTVYFV